MIHAETSKLVKNTQTLSCNNRFVFCCVWCCVDSPAPALVLASNNTSVHNSILKPLEEDTTSGYHFTQVWYLFIIHFYVRLPHNWLLSLKNNYNNNNVKILNKTVKHWVCLIEDRQFKPKQKSVIFPTSCIAVCQREIWGLWVKMNFWVNWNSADYRKLKKCLFSATLISFTSINLKKTFLDFQV